MREAVPDWEVSEAAWSALTVGLLLPDADDVHVLAAAIAGHADCVVTSNLKDSPATDLSDFGIEAVDPDTFLVSQWDLDPIIAMAAFKRMRERRKQPQSNALEFVEEMERCGLLATAEGLRYAAVQI